MSEPHPYCTEHDQPLDWCAHPAPAACYRSVTGVMVHGPGCQHDDGTREPDEPLVRTVPPLTAFAPGDPRDDDETW